MEKDEKNEEQKEKKPAGNDPIINILGELGPYQIFFSLLIFLSKFPTGWQTVATVFLAAKMKANCSEPADVEICDKDCKEYTYDRSVFQETIISSFDLVCDKAFLAELSQSIFMLGILIGSVVVGNLADRYGRRPLFIGVCMVLLTMGSANALAPYYYVYCIFRFIVGCAMGGIMVTSFVLIMEIVGTKKRELMSILYQIPFNIGHGSLGVYAYFIRDWRWFQFAITSFSVVYLSYFCLVPESPRWLLTTGRLDEAEKVLTKMAAKNKRPTEGIRAELERSYEGLKARGSSKKGTFADLFRWSNLRIRTLAMAFEWLVVSMVYYGVAQYLSKMSGNIFLNVGISGFLGVPGTLICIPMTMYLGRKKTLITSNCISAIGLLGLCALPKTAGSWQVVMGTLGLFGASITYPNVYLYGGELFPTVVRSSGLGFCSMVGRIGSIVAPLISLLTEVAIWMPAAVFGAFSLAASLVTFLLPETRGHALPETIEDGEKFGKIENTVDV